MMKYSAVSGNENMIDEETLEQLIQNSVVSKYRLKTGVFPVEGRTIPGFMGTLGIKFYGSLNVREEYWNAYDEMNEFIINRM